MNRPLVSVIIPTFNGASWIEETLASVFAQSYSAIEIVVIDDLSTDNTLDILKKHGSKIRILQNTHNLGVSEARNRGIKEASGDYIALLDHDDLWAPDKLTKQMALFEKNPLLGTVFSDCYYLEPSSRKRRSFEFSAPARGMIFKALLNGSFIPCLTAVVPKAIIAEMGAFRKDLHYSEDYELFLRIARRFLIDYIDEPLATYRIHDKNFSRRRDVYYTELIDVLKMFTRDAPLWGELSVQYLQLARVQLKQAHFLGVIKSLLQFVVLGISHPAQLVKALRKALQQRKTLRRLA